LCAFDNKRYLLADGINTLAFGHRDIVQNLEQDRENFCNRDKVFTDREARELGLLWKRRAGLYKHLMRIPYRCDEENEGDAIAAGLAQRDRILHVIDQDPIIPYRFQPVSGETRNAIGQLARNQPPLKYRSVERGDVAADDEQGGDASENSISQIPEKRRRIIRGVGSAIVQDEVELDAVLLHDSVSSDVEWETTSDLDNSFIVSDIVFD